MKNSFALLLTGIIMLSIAECCMVDKRVGEQGAAAAPYSTMYDSCQAASAVPAWGYFRCGIPYTRIGSGQHILVVFQGLVFENKPQPQYQVGMYRFLDSLYTVYVVLRRPGLARGYTIKNMADDYATLIREEFCGGPVDILGVSTGGSIALHFAADHPDLVRRLVIQSSACTLSDDGKALQLRVADLAGKRRWIRAYAAILGYMLPHHGIGKIVSAPPVWLGAFLVACLSSPREPDDLIVTVEAEDQLDFCDRLSQITVPTLVVAGKKDPFYPEELFRRTADGIPGCRLILYPKMGHPAVGKNFESDVLHFLCE